MKVSNRLRYGVRAMFDLAFHGRAEAVQIKDIAEREDIPQRFLEQIFQDLRRAGLVTSKRGPKGGYALARANHELSLGDVLRALEGPVHLHTADNGQVAATADAASVGVVDSSFRELSNSLESCFDLITLEDLCERAQAAGVRRSAGAGYSYVI